MVEKVISETNIMKKNTENQVWETDIPSLSSLKISVYVYVYIKAIP